MGQTAEEPVYGELKMDPWNTGADIFLLKDMIKELVRGLRKKGLAKSIDKGSTQD